MWSTLDSFIKLTVENVVDSMKKKAFFFLSGVRRRKLGSDEAHRFLPTDDTINILGFSLYH